MNGNEVKQWGVSVKGTKQVRGGEAIEITLEVSGESLRRAVDKLKAMPFVANMPGVQKVIAFIEVLLAAKDANDLPPAPDREDPAFTHTITIQEALESESNKKEA